MARRARETAPGPAIGGPIVPGLGVGQGSSSGGSWATPGKRQVPVEGKPCPNPRPIQSLLLLPGKNTRGLCQNVAFPILGGAALCKCWDMGLSCFDECPKKGSHTHTLASVVDKIAAEMVMARAPVVGADGST